MFRVRAIPLVAGLMTGLLLSACSGTSNNFDPTDWISGDFFDTKTKLPGERKPVFPTGVPGVPEGVPPELVKGNQQPVVEAAASAEPAPAAKPARPAAPKPRTASAPPQPAQVRAAPAAKPAQPATTSQPAAAWPDPGTAPAPRPAQSTAPAANWPDPTNTQANWPPPDPSSFSR